MLAVLGRSWDLCWRVLGRSWALLGGLEPLLEPMLAVLGRSWAYVDGLGALLGPKLAVLGRSRGPSGWSWDAFGPK